MRIHDLFREFPDAIITMKVSDLIEANELLLKAALRELSDNVHRIEGGALMTREDVIKQLNVAPSTLWRWKKSGYLVPISVGGQYRYRPEDILDIMEGRK